MRHQFTSFATSILLCCWVVQGNAAEVNAAEESDGSTTWEWLEDQRDGVSRGVTNLGRRIDAWLAGEGVGEHENETYLRVDFFQQVGSLDGYHSRLDVSGSLDLPGASERWRLIFESDDEDQNSLQDTVLGRRNSNTSVGALRYLQELPGNWNISHDFGVKTDIPIDPYYRLKVDTEYELGNAWSVGFAQRIWYYHHDGWGYNTDLVFNRQLAKDRVLQITTEVRYQKDDNITEFAQLLSVHRPMGNLRSLTYSLGLLGVSEPNTRVNAYFVEGRYRQAIWEDWLFLEITPQIVVDRDENWRPETRLVANLEVMFFDF